MDLYLKTTKGFTTRKETKGESSQKLQEGSGPIVCRFCGHEITKAEHIISVDGAHRHVFTNPAGITFEIGCFSRADGCLLQGIPTYEHTWFKGYKWNYAHCMGCLVHLGWFYQGADSGFFGLILDRLMEAFHTQ